MEPLLQLDSFSKSYGAVRAVRGVTFSVDPGELYGLIGPDGAGKTTTMRCIVTLLRPGAGVIRVRGMDSVREIARVRRIVGYMPQRFSLYPDLSIDQNLNFFAELHGVEEKEIGKRKERLYRFSRLEPFKERLAGKLSGGMKQKLALSCTLIHNPALLVLDEPTTGVDPVSRAEFWDILSELRAEGVTILVSTPYMDEALRCDRVAIMHEGDLLLEGDPRKLGARFTARLFRLRLAEPHRAVPLLAGAPGVLSVQAFGDSLHITAEKGRAAGDLERAIAERLGAQAPLAPIEPSLEDIFIRLIEEQPRSEA